MLCDGEVKERLCWKSHPDDEGLCECSPEVSLCMAEIKERKFRMRRGITVDSGSGDNVIPRRMINAKRIRPSAGSKRGLHYVSATDHRIPNEGEIDLNFETAEGHMTSWPFQVADVNKPLLCVADRVDNRCRVVYDQDDETGEDLTDICDKKTGKTMNLRRIGKVWVLDAIVAANMLADTASVFSRPR